MEAVPIIATVAGLSWCAFGFAVLAHFWYRDSKGASE